MYYAITNIDRPGALDLRISTRAAHREYLHGTHQGLELKLAGPLLAEDGETMIGSHIVVRADSREAVERFCAGDPYRQVGLFVDVQIRGWHWTTGNPDLSE